MLRTVHNSVLWIDWQAIGRWTTRSLAHAEVIAVSQAASATDFAILGKAPVPPCEIIYNGVKPPPPRPSSDPIAQERPFRLLFAGRFVAQKGCDLLPAIFSATAAEVPDRAVSVTIAGHGVLASELEGIRAPDLWQIDLVPPIVNLADLLCEFDGVIMPSRHEGLVLLGIESLLARVPLVATRAPGLDEILPPQWPLVADVDDVAGLARQLARLISDSERYAALAGDARDWLTARFSVEAMLSAHARRYRGAKRP